MNEFAEFSVYLFVSLLFSDMFRGPEVEKIRLVGLEQALTFTLCNGRVYARNYRYRYI